MVHDMAEAADQPRDDPLVSLREPLRLPADRYGKRLRAVLNEIDQLHGVPRIKPIGVKINNDRGVLGRYVKHPGTGEPLRIELSRRKNDRLELTFAHEVGHFLEGAVIPGSTFGVRKWAFDDVTQSWRAAIRSTSSFQRLRSIVEAGGTIPGLEEAPQFVSYLLQDQELWARSYAQYVAVRSHSETLLEQIHPRCFPQSAVPIQWNREEFEPVAEVIETLLERIGWRK